MLRGPVVSIVLALAFYPAVITTFFVVAFTSWMPLLVFFATWIGWALIVLAIYIGHSLRLKRA